MGFINAWLGVGFLWSACSWGWISRNCFMSDDPEAGIFQIWNCSYKEYTVNCEHLTDFKKDLAGLPTYIQALYLLSDKEGLLLPHTFSAFQNLENLFIRSCHMKILPGAFQGLSSLQCLSLEYCEGMNFDISIKPHAFSGLPKLRILHLSRYKISTAMLEVFNKIPRLEELYLHKCYIQRLADVLCRVINITSLRELQVEDEDLPSLTYQNCSSINITVSKNATFQNLKAVSLRFPNISYIEKDALKYFRHLSFLSIKGNESVLSQLLLSGVREVNTLRYANENTDLENICKIVSVLMIKNLQLQQYKISNYSVSAAESCQGLGELSLSGLKADNYLDFTFICALKNLTVLYVELNAQNISGFSLLCKYQPDPVTWLATLSLNYGRAQNIPGRTFFCLVNLEKLDLSNNFIYEIENYAFQGLARLQFLNLERNKISHIKAHYFSELHNLKTLKLRWNQLSRIEANSFINLASLQELWVESLKPQDYESKVKRNMLENLDLSYNFIYEIENCAFQGLLGLQFLNLGDNKLSHIEAHYFSELHNLKSLRLKGNRLAHIEENSFKNLASLQELWVESLTPQDYESTVKLNMTYIFNSIPSELTNLTIVSGVYPIHIIIGSNTKPKSRLNLYIRGKTVFFGDCERPFFKSIVRMYVQAEQLLCGSDFMAKYCTFIEDLEYVSSFTDNFLELTGLNQLVHLRRLKLHSIDFNTQPSLDIMFHNLSKLEELYLYKCRIDSLQRSLSKDLNSLKKLFLNIRCTFNMMESFIEQLKHLRHIYFYNSDLYCKCDNAWLIQWAKQQRQIEFSIHDPPLELMECVSEHNRMNFVKYAKENCATEIEFVLFVSTACWLVFFILLVLVYSLAGAYIIALFHIARGWLDEALHPRAGTHYLFDAFVSYCGKDERWVFEELLPNLEKRGPPFLNLCLHNRDFQLGKDIVDNITDSLYRSRRTLCLVSTNYLRSNWCALELRLATHRLLVERRDVLILVFLEKIPPFQLSAHHRLARLVKTRTYLDWPEDPNQRTMFWDRLWAKLTPAQV